nr:VOC family protein [Motilibacter aurantiacus]
MHSPDPAASLAFYGQAFGWSSLPGDPAPGWAMVTLPGYGAHLASTVDPGIFERQKLAPEGFADVVAGIARARGGEAPRWHVQLTVADRDRSAAHVQQLGGTVVSTTRRRRPSRPS